MVTRDKINRGLLGYQAYEVLYHHHMCRGPITFAELPDIDNVAVEDYRLWFDAFQVLEELFCVTAVGAKREVDIVYLTALQCPLLSSPFVTSMKYLVMQSDDYYIM